MKKIMYVKKTSCPEKSSIQFRGENFTSGITDGLCEKLKLYGIGKLVFKYARQNLQAESSGNYDGDQRHEVMKKQVETEQKKNKELSREDLHLNVISGKKPEMIRVSVKEWEKKKEYYEEALKTLEEYCNFPKVSIKEEEYFMVFYMCGMVYNHLQDYKKAATSFFLSRNVLDRAQKNQECWAEVFLKREVYSNLSKRISKNELKAEVDKVEQILSVEDFLGKKSLIEKKFKEIFGRKKVEELFKGMKTCEFNKKVLEYLACSMLEEGSRTNVIFVGHETPMDEDCGGYYNNKNTIRIFIFQFEDEEMYTDDSIKDSTLHEIVHWAMQKLFNSDTRLYICGDKEAIKAHNEAIKRVLWNIAREVLSLEDLKKLKKENVIRSENEKIEIYLEEVFREDMDTESLAKNVVKLSCLVGKIIKSVLAKDKESKVFLKFAPKRVEVSGDILEKVFKNIETVFNGYAFDNRDAEFITTVIVPVTLTEGFREGLLGKIFKPYMDYLEKYVMPKLREAVMSHPKYGVFGK